MIIEQVYKGVVHAYLTLEVDVESERIDCKIERRERECEKEKKSDEKLRYIGARWLRRKEARDR